MSADRVQPLDPERLPRHFDAEAAEKKWDEAWQKAGVYHYDPERARAETFVVDTPPPTVSGSLHIGHVFSYTQTDVVVRYQRMRGKNIYYPIGWDDNGVPTERRVQNLFHVRCDPSLPSDPDLQIEEATSKIRKKPPRVLSRADFIALCHQVTQEDEKAFLALWRRVGLSVDWREEYATIDDRCRHLAQLSFRDLYEKDEVYTVEAPFMWDVDFQMALSQADVEDKQDPGAFHDIEFGVVDSDAHLHDRDDAARAARRLRRRHRAPGRRALPAALRQAGAHSALPRAGADLPERQGRPREGHRHPDGLYLRRPDRRRVVARGRAGPAPARRARRPRAEPDLRRGRLRQPRSGVRQPLPRRDRRQAAQARAHGDRRAPPPARGLGDRGRRAAPGRAARDRARGEVLREGRAPARDPAEPAVVR